MLSWDDFDKNEEIKKEEPVQNKVIETVSYTHLRAHETS